MSNLPDSPVPWSPIEQPEGKWDWTAKLPALIAGFVALIVAAALLTYRKHGWPVVLAAGLILIAIVLLVWSASTGSWCTPPNRAFGDMHWGKGFYHEPSITDCFKLTK